MNFQILTPRVNAVAEKVFEFETKIYQSGISRVFYGQPYRDDAGIKFLEKSKVIISAVEKYNVQSKI